MNDGAALTGHGWTLANFTGAIHRGRVALWAWSPVRRVAQLDSLCREFWGTPNRLVGIDDLFDRVILATTAHAAREIVTSCLSEGILRSDAPNGRFRAALPVAHEAWLFPGLFADADPLARPRLLRR